MDQWYDNPFNPQSPRMPLDGPATLNLDGDSEGQIADALARRTQRDGVQGWYYCEAWRANEILHVGKLTVEPAAPKLSPARVVLALICYAAWALALQVFAQ